MSGLKDKQYGDSSKYSARINLHSRYSTNKYLWPLWVFDRIEKSGDADVLEIGCGNALLWRANSGRIPESWRITLSDFSEGMLKDAALNTLKLNREFAFEVVDAENIPFDNNSFDIIIANHMMYHIPDRERALSGVKR